MFCLLFCLLWVQLLASDEKNERPKFSSKNIIKMGETRSIPTKSFDISVARPILISTEDSIEPDSNSTSDEKVTTRSTSEGTGCLRKWYIINTKSRNPTISPDSTPERAALPPMKTEYDKNGKMIHSWRTEADFAALKAPKPLTKEEKRMKIRRKCLNAAKLLLCCCCCCCLTFWCD